MAREVAAAEAKRFGRAAGMLSVGVGSAGLLTYVYFSLASHDLDKVALRRGGRPLVGGLHDDLGPVSAGRAAALAHDRRASGARAADRPAAAGRGDDPARPRAAPSRSRRSRSAGRSRTTSCPATRRSTGSSSRAVLAYARELLRPGLPRRQPALRALPALLLAESTARMSFALAVAVGIASGQTAVALGIVAAPRAQPDRRAARLRGPRRRPEPAPRRRRSAPASGRSEFTLARGGGFAAAVLLIMLSEQTFLNAGPLLVRASEGAAAAGFIFNVLMIARAPLRPLPGGADQPPPPPDPAALQRGRRATPRPSGSRSGSRWARSPPSPRWSALVVLIAGPAADADRLRREVHLRPRRAC